MSALEWFLVITIILFALAFLFEKVSDLIKQLKSGSAKLIKGFEAKLSVVPIDSKKSEVSATDTNSTNEQFD